MTSKTVYYLDAGIVNNVGHNLETVEFLKKYLGQHADCTVVAGKKFAGSVDGIRVLPLLRYGSPHWSMPSRKMRYLMGLRRRLRLPFIDHVVPLIKVREMKQELSTLSFPKNAQIIINSVELDDAYMQCEALWSLEPTLNIKVILHYSPFDAHSVIVRPKLKRALKGISKLSPQDNRITFYADTDKLCQVYAALLQRPVTLLPIPHAKRGGNTPRDNPSSPYRVVYFGTYSEAKAPHLIPEIIRLIHKDVALDWSVYITYITKNPIIDSFERELRTLETKTGKSIYHTGPFSTQHIEDIFDQSDIFLVPYHSHDYELQSSGVVMEALVSGKVPLVSRSMADAALLARIDPHLVFRPNNEMDIADNLEYIAKNYSEIRAKLRPLQQQMEAFHNPETFIKILLA